MRAARILAADDERGIRDLLEFALPPHGFEVTVVGDGAAALACLRASTFDLVVLDVHMPKMGGLETLAQIREILPEQRVVVMSGSAHDPDLEKRSLELGAHRCLLKPVDMDELLDVLREGFESGGGA